MAVKKSTTQPKSAKTAKKAPKKAATRAPKEAAKKAPKKVAKKAVAKLAPKKASAEAKKKTDAAKPVSPKNAARPSGVSSMDVTLGHVFALRPRVDRSFRQSNLQAAKRTLQDEAFADLTEAARAVADEALKMTRDSSRPAHKGWR